MSCATTGFHAIHCHPTDRFFSSTDVHNSLFTAKRPIFRVPSNHESTSSKQCKVQSSLKQKWMKKRRNATDYLPLQHTEPIASFPTTTLYIYISNKKLILNLISSIKIIRLFLCMVLVLSSEVHRHRHTISITVVMQFWYPYGPYPPPGIIELDRVGASAVSIDRQTGFNQGQNFSFFDLTVNRSRQ